MATLEVVETLVTPDSRTASVTLTTSDSTAVGDTLIILYGSDYYTLANMPNPTSSAGALALLGTMDAGTNTIHAKVFMVSVGTPGAKTVTFPNHIDCDIFGYVLRVPEVLTVDAALESIVNLTSSVSHVAPSVETTGTARLLVCLWLTTNANSEANPYVLPAGMTPHGQVRAAPFSASACASELVHAVGETGTRTATFSSARMSGAVSIAFAGPADEETPGETTVSPGAKGPTFVGPDLRLSYGIIPKLQSTLGVPGNALVNVTATPTQSAINNNFRALSDKIDEILTVLTNDGTLS